jgi:two-component system, cell cycle response regulator DivK
MANELVMVIEDNDLNRKLLRDVLNARGYRVAESVTAEEGLEMIRAQMPRLVLMDLQLPGMDGIMALRRLKEDPVTKAIPVVAVTASAMPQERTRIVAAGFDGYLTKPLSVREFLAELARILGS